MAETALTPGKAQRAFAGTAPVALTETAADNVNGNSFPNTGREVIVARNTSGAPQTVTVKDRNGNTPDGARSIAAGKTVVLGPYPAFLYNDASGNLRIATSASSVNLVVATLDHPGLITASP